MPAQSCCHLIPLHIGMAKEIPETAAGHPVTTRGVCADEVFPVVKEK